MMVVWYATYLTVGPQHPTGRCFTCSVHIGGAAGGAERIGLLNIEKQILDVSTYHKSEYTFIFEGLMHHRDNIEGSIR